MHDHYQARGSQPDTLLLGIVAYTCQLQCKIHVRSWLVHGIIDLLRKLWWKVDAEEMCLAIRKKSERRLALCLVRSTPLTHGASALMFVGQSSYSACRIIFAGGWRPSQCWSCVARHRHTPTLLPIRAAGKCVSVFTAILMNRVMLTPVCSFCMDHWLSKWLCMLFCVNH